MRDQADDIWGDGKSDAATPTEFFDVEVVLTSGTWTLEHVVHFELVGNADAYVFGSADGRRRIVPLNANVLWVDITPAEVAS